MLGKHSATKLPNLAHKHYSKRRPCSLFICYGGMGGQGPWETVCFSPWRKAEVGVGTSWSELKRGIPTKDHEK